MAPSVASESATRFVNHALTFAGADCRQGERCCMNIDLLMILVLAALTLASAAYIVALTKL